METPEKIAKVNARIGTHFFVTQDKRLASTLEKLGYRRQLHAPENLDLTWKERQNAFVFNSSSRILRLVDLYERGRLFIPPSVDEKETA